MACSGCKKQRVKPTQMAKLGGWSIQPEAYSFIIKNLEYGSTILELGSGFGTQVLSEKYKMASIEHNKRFIGKYNSTYIHAPMKGHWYDVNLVRNGLPEKYDMILIDGPVGSESKNRIGFWENIGLFNTNVLMLFDDTNRAGERHLFEKCLEFVNENAENPRKSETFKTFSVIYGKV
jgi:hypothetical protein